ncbi:hypothetical protein RI543_001387 [Arxiozyma heterogenica]|uniref:BHLH domain-containing protein n=1 Tax=Arxiozyma heterogenica TaxID=278026 RepID=A0AAN7WN70_9SACH|nr:hypothetical protein RI543_001387 [Kazachstania heterogenica]
MDPLDLFNLDADIDFETAYRMLSDFDSFNNQITTTTNSNTHNTPLDHHSGYTQQPQQHVVVNHLKNVLPTNHTDPQISVLNHQDILLHNHLSSQGVGDELLSAYEANAIEQFLDNLLSLDSNQTIPSNVSASSSDIKHKYDNSNNNYIKDELMEKHLTSHNLTQKNTASLIKTTVEITESNDSRDTIKDAITSESEDIITSSMFNEDIDNEYIPQPINIPEITLDLLDCPEHLISKTNSLEFKKWKHVEVEKLRRNQTKKAFDQLVSLQNKYSKPLSNKSKRVAKYQLLTQVKHDIQNLIKANRFLEEIITRDSERMA